MPGGHIHLRRLIFPAFRASSQLIALSWAVTPVIAGFWPTTIRASSSRDWCGRRGGSAGRGPDRGAEPEGKGRLPNVKAWTSPATWPSRRRSGCDPAPATAAVPARVTPVPSAPSAAQPGGLTRRIRPMRRKGAAIGYRILRVSHFLRIIHSGGASAGTWLSRVPLATFRKPSLASADHNPRETGGKGPR